MNNWRAGIEDCTLSAANTLGYKRLCKDGVAEFNPAGLRQYDPVLIRDNPQRDYATPWLGGTRKLAFCWTPVYIQGSWVTCKQGLGDAYLVQVPDERGRVIPEIASMRDDFPAL